MSDATSVTGAPGAQSHVPGQDENDGGAAGAAPGGGGLDAALDPDAPARDSLDASGDSLGDDDVPPGTGDGPEVGETGAAAGRPPL